MRPLPLVIAAVVVLAPLSPVAASEEVCEPVDTAGLEAAASEQGTDLWYSFVDGRIAVNTAARPPLFLTPEWTANADRWDGNDYKPVPSPDGTKVAFFRLVEQASWAFAWKTQIWVMDADGCNPRQLTSGEHTDVNLQWTRDGSNKIFWNRIEPGLVGSEAVIGFPFPLGMNVWWTDADASPGSEVKISLRGVEPLTPFEFAYSGLKDGRILVRSEGFNQYLLLTPAPKTLGLALYEPVRYPEHNTLLHKMSVSPSETKVAYMKVANAGPLGIAQGPDPRSVIAYADFDPVAGTISNEVVITNYDLGDRTWYPSWSRDETKIRYACSGDCTRIVDGVVVGHDDPAHGQIYEYDLTTGSTSRVSHDLGRDYRYPSTVGIVK